MSITPRIAYFSMEIGIDPALHTYSGGLGILAGDTIRAAADLGVPMVAVSLVHHRGYFRQQLDAAGGQEMGEDPWAPGDHLEEVPGVLPRVELAGREVVLRAWRYPVEGATGHRVPVYFLDSDLPENGEEDRQLTHHLYGGDDRYRLQQEVLLGVGGVRLLRALGHDRLDSFHLNEGHCALLTLELLREAGGERERVRRQCVFTTHTPVPAGHDAFERSLVEEQLGVEDAATLLDWAGDDGRLNLTHLGLAASRYVNGVALRHGEVSREMFPGHEIHAITNGVHVASWSSPPFRQLFDEFLPGWRQCPLDLRHAVRIPVERIRQAHAGAKGLLLDAVAQRTGRQLDPQRFTLGFARRATGYKRASLLFRDDGRLREIAEQHPLQVVFAGKAHPRDEEGQQLIREIFSAADTLGDALPVVYLENYDMELGALMSAGVDCWLNNPRKPLEASGTSGMKSALNGVPCLSTVDGWWVEGHVEGVTGWAIGGGAWEDSHDGAEAESLYRQLGGAVLPTYYDDPARWGEIMRHCIVLNGASFSAHRMMLQYLQCAYGMAGQR